MLNKLYWWENLKTDEIASLYGVCQQAVCNLLKRYGIERRKGGPRIEGCRVSKCDNPPCKIRRWKNGAFHWGYTSRCAIHHHEYVRRSKRIIERWSKGLTGEGVFSRRPLTGKLAMIAREDM